MSVPYIEIIGVPGSGKSTIFDRLIQKRHQLFSQSPLSLESLPAVNDRVIRNRAVNKGNKVTKWLRKFMYIGTPWARMQHLENFDITRSTDLMAFIKSYEEHICVARKGISLEGDNRPEFEVSICYSRFLEQLIAYQLAELGRREYEVVLSDQFLIHNFLRLFPMSDISKEYVIEYVNSLPEPLALIQLKPNSHTVKKRVLKRGKKATHHMDKSPDEIYEWTNSAMVFFDQLSTAFDKKNVPVFKIDSDNGNVEKICQEVIKTLNYNEGVLNKRFLNL